MSVVYSNARSDALRPASSASWKNTTRPRAMRSPAGERKREKSFTCCGVSAVPHGATTFLMPASCMEMASKYPSTTTTSPCAVTLPLARSSANTVLDLL